MKIGTLTITYADEFDWWDVTDESGSWLATFAVAADAIAWATEREGEK